MTTYQITQTTTIHIWECSQCAAPIALTERHLLDARTNGRDFYCPNGHCQVFKDTENARLTRELAAAQERANAEATRSALAERTLAEATKREARLRRRVHAGVCPLCHRTFRQLAAHMQTKHQDQAPTPAGSLP